MPEPCRSCDRRSVDFGGCRCQAYHLTGDVTATDPACSLAPAHGLIEAARDEALTAPTGAVTYRTPRDAERA
jgi:pyrroloquinoline quinone biosynthesis protein E